MQKLVIVLSRNICKNELYATATTGRLIEEVAKFECSQVFSRTSRRCPADVLTNRTKPVRYDYIYQRPTDTTVS